MNDDVERLIADLDAVPRDLRRSMRPMLPFTRQEPRGWRDVLRCLLGRHRVVLSGRDAGMFIERCSCGAIRLSHRGWFEAHPFTLRDADGYTRRQRKEQRQITEAVDRTMQQHFPGA